MSKSAIDIDKPKRKWGGSRKGIPNKNTKALKDMILGALSDAGGQAYLTRQANENPGSFMQLVGKVLPTTLASADDKPLEIRITRTIVE